MSTDIVAIFHKLSLPHLKRISKVEGFEYEKEPTKKAVATDIADRAFDNGVRMLTAKMNKVDLLEAVNGLNIDFGERQPPKVVLTKRLNEQIMELGLEKYFAKLSTTDVILRFADLLEVETDKHLDLTDEDSRKEVISRIDQRIYFFGIQSVLDHLDVPLLQTICREYGLKGETSTKSKLVYAFATQTDIKDLPSFNPASQAAKEATLEAAIESANKLKRPAIAKGVTYQDMFQLYSREELQDWCRDNNLKVSGTKPEFIDRILAFLDEEKENTKSVVNSKPAKKEEKKVEKKSGNKSKTESPKKKAQVEKVESTEVDVE